MKYSCFMFEVWAQVSKDKVNAAIRAEGVRDEYVIQQTLALPIGSFYPWEVQSSPATIARVAEALRIKRSHKVLEIGTGTGYLTALLSVLAKEVVTMEIRSTLARVAVCNLRNLKMGSNVT